MHSPQLESREVVYKNRYQQVYRVVANFSGFTKEYFVTDYGQRAGIMVEQEGSLLLVRQYRLLIDRLSWEIPGGKIDDGETPEVAAVRECLEETGIRCRNLKPLLFFHPGLDATANPTHLFYTHEFTETKEKHLNPQEMCEHVWIPLSRCLEMVFTQQIVDSMSILALLAYHTLKTGQGHPIFPPLT